jgi:PAS domain S-box-containing protein
MNEALISDDRADLMLLQSSIVEATGDAVVALDSSLNVRYCNASAEQLYGVRLQDVAGKSLAALHGYAWINKGDELRCLTDLARQGSWKGEYIHILNNGSRIVVQSTVNILEPAAGGGMVAVIRDITERKSSELKSTKHSAELTRANEDLLDFAYAVSHDLKTPLRTVVSFVQLLADQYGPDFDEQATELLRFIVEAASGMNRMLDDLMQFAHSAGERSDFTERVMLEDALSAAIAALNSSAEETHAVITHDELPVVVADAGQMVQLFQNLIGNSLKYRKPGEPPRVHISANRSEQEWVLTVRDNGIGFDSKDAEYIFRVFKRLHGKEIVGNGIGLTICKRIVERRGGRIWAEAKPREGAAFYFTIPDSQEPIQGAPAMAWDEMLRSFNPSRIGEISKALDLAQVIVRDPDGTIVYLTKGAVRLFGFGENEAFGKKLHSLLRAELAMSHEAVEAALLRDGEWTGEMKVYRSNNTSVWLAVHKVECRDRDGRLKLVVEVFNDITSLKRLG